VLLNVSWQQQQAAHMLSSRNNPLAMDDPSIGFKTFKNYRLS
jgi:hypothetical protein